MTARDQLAARLSRAIGALDDPATPMVVVDLDALDANLADLAHRAAGTPIRLASKSVRVPALINRALEHPGVQGVLAYALREALWLAREGLCDDVVMGYPTVDLTALTTLAGDPDLVSRVTLMIDDPTHLDLLDEARRAARASGAAVRVAIDIDAGLRWQPPRGPMLAVGPKRSPLFEPGQVVALAREVLARGLVLDGVMTYEGQVAGVPDDVPDQRARSFVVRRLKRASVAQLAERRATIAAALREVAEPRFWNAGGSGSIESTVADPVVTEVAAGSGLLVPGLFDHYRSFTPHPAAFYGVPVVRRPSAEVATVAGGGFVASGAHGKDRLPIPYAPDGLELTGLEGAGEVQTPLTGPGAAGLRIGDWVWFRHAKAGELMEHTDQVHLLAGDKITDSVPSYRGLGLTW